MKVSTAISFLCLTASTCSAFLPSTPFLNTVQHTIAPKQSLNMAATYELVAEPEGGDEVQSINTMADSRMKNMGLNTELKSEDGSEVYTFWLTASADAKMIKEFRTQVEKDASRNANFPGFRKGQIPPWAKPQLTMFAVQEGLIKTCEAAVTAYGLKALPGSDGSVEVHEDVKDISKGYKVGDSIQFTATFAATIETTAEVEEEEEEKEEETVSAEE